MRLNENITICGEKVILVPYRAEHVPTYHEWMKSPELLELTASEPLTLEEEYDMQRKWHTDDDRSLSLTRVTGIPSPLRNPELTFILLARPGQLPSSSHPTLSPTELKSCRMIGDVNMFLPDGPIGDGECEIMIASIDDRGKGYAREALRLFLSYATNSLKLPPSHLIARIGTTNAPSIRLFQSLGFGIVKVVEVFQEVEMRWGHKPDIEKGEAAAERLGYSMPEGRIGVYDGAESAA